MQGNLLLPFLLASFAAGMAASRKPTQRRYLNLRDHKHKSPFADAVLAGGVLYLSGRIGLDPRTGRLPDDIEQEIRFLLDGLKEALTAAQMKMDKLAFVQIFCPDLSLYDRFNAIYRTYYDKNLPARAFIGSGPLLFGAHFELIGIAAQP